MSERRAVTKTIATRYVRADRGAKKVIVDELCAKAVKRGSPLPPLCGEPVIDALRFCWAVKSTPCGRLLAAALLVRLRDPIRPARYVAERDPLRHSI